MATKLFSPIPFGTTHLKNRIVMAPMTRSRAIGNIPNKLMSRYYGQRADAGLIVTEGTAPSPNGLGYARIPGLFTREQVQGWHGVTDVVHAAGGKIFVQLMHTGRVSHPTNQPAGARVLGPSAVALAGTMYTDADGMQPFPVPEAMSEADIEATIAEFVASSRAAIDAGFDGVELHGANGYLIDQFLNAASNQRTDRWGGAVENRIRFALEIARRVGEAIGFQRLGIRLSPHGTFNGMQPDAEMDRIYERLVEEVGKLGLVYLHLVNFGESAVRLTPRLRKRFAGHLILSGGYDLDRAEADLVEGKSDLIAFGRPFISNPSLVTKLRDGAALVAADPTTFYTPGEHGYTDYA